MRAWLLSRPGPLESSPVALGDAPEPRAGDGEVLVRVEAAPVDATDLAVARGEIPIARFPVVAGQAAAGVVESPGIVESPGGRFAAGDRVVVSRLRSACGACALCTRDFAHLCARRAEHGVHADGGLAERVAAPASALVEIPDELSFIEAAALAGDAVLGYRAFLRRPVMYGERLGILGYGPAGVVAQLYARSGGASATLVFTRSEPHRQLARALGAEWAGAIEDHPATAEPLDAVLSLGIAGRVLPAALRHLRPGGALVFASASFSEAIPALDYARHLDRERGLLSVSSAPRFDVFSLLRVAAEDPSFRVPAEPFAFDAVPAALEAVEANRVRGAAVVSALRR